MKTAVYTGTRNLYSDMITAAKSLTINSSVDVIYFLIEDSVFPEELPEHIQCIDVSKQKFINRNGPNVYKLWTWMTLMRAILTKFFPEQDRILSLDVDTIVDKNIDELWDLDLTNYYLAGVPEPKKSTSDMAYVNMGAVMHNLSKIRGDIIDKEFIYRLNNIKYPFAEQDCINSICGKNILLLPSTYNANNWTSPCDEPKIIHYACDKTYNKKPLWLKYQDMSWDEIKERKVCGT